MRGAQKRVQAFHRAVESGRRYLLSSASGLQFAPEGGFRFRLEKDGDLGTKN